MALPSNNVGASLAICQLERRQQAVSATQVISLAGQAWKADTEIIGLVIWLAQERNAVHCDQHRTGRNTGIEA
jgi:hypothetical protein